MKTHLPDYLLESSLCLLVLCGCYWLLLRRDRLFGFRRVFILAAILFSVSLPFVRIPVSGSVVSPLPMVALPTFAATATAQPEAGVWHFQNILFWLYWLAVAGGVVRVGLQIARLWRLSRRFPSRQMEGYRLMLTQGATPTFSFFNWLFYDDSQQLTAAEQQQILTHEQTHIRQRHSLDVLLAELAATVFWFHPAMHLFKRELRAVHEHLADAEAVQASSPEAYIRLIRSQLLQRMNLSLTQPFNQFQLKQRIAMLRHNAPAKPHLWKVAASLAFLSAVVLVFACTERITPISQGVSAVSGKVIDEKGNPLAGAVIVVKGKTTGTSTDGEGKYTLSGVAPGDELAFSYVGRQTQLVPFVGGKDVSAMLPKGENMLAGVHVVAHVPPPPQSGEEPFVVVEKMPEFPGGMDGMQKYLAENIRYPKAAREKKTYGKVFVSFVVTETGDISEVQILKGTDPDIDAEALRVVKSLPKFIPGRQSGRNVPVRMQMPFVFDLDSGK